MEPDRLWSIAYIEGPLYTHKETEDGGDHWGKRAQAQEAATKIAQQDGVIAVFLYCEDDGFLPSDVPTASRPLVMIADWIRA